MKKLIIITMCALFAVACGGAGGGSSLAVKSGGKDVKFDIKGSSTYISVMTYTEKPTGDGVVRASRGTSYSIDLVNFEPNDTVKVKPLTADSQIRVHFGFVGEENSDEKAPFKVGTYTVGAERWNKFDGASITTFADGKEKADDFGLMSSTPSAKGQLKITAVTGDSVSGEVDITDKDRSIKGSFTAKIVKK